MGAKIVPAAQITAAATNMISINAPYVTFQNFEVNGVNQATSDTAAAGIKCQSGANHCNVIGNNIHDIGVNNTLCPAGAGILSAADSDVVMGNYIHNVSPPRTAGFRCNQIHGIYINGGNNGFVQNNIIFEVWQGLAIQFYSNDPNGWTASNNTIFNCGDSRHSSGGGILLACPEAGTCDNNNVNNNIIANGQYVCIMQTQETGTWGANNLMYNNDEYSCGNDYITQTGNHLHTITTNPTFVNYTGTTTGDYHLQSSSPAINAGTSLGAPSVDYDGISRPQGTAYDMGAYEYH